MYIIFLDFHSLVGLTYKRTLFGWLPDCPFVHVIAACLSDILWNFSVYHKGYPYIDRELKRVVIADDFRTDNRGIKNWFSKRSLRNLAKVVRFVRDLYMISYENWELASWLKSLFFMVRASK